MKIEDKIVGYEQCSFCKEFFYQTNGNQKYCCLFCKEQANKELNKKRAKKYLNKEKNHKKHLIRMATYRLIQKNVVEKQKKCCQCGADNKLQFHHIIYDDSYITVGLWLCKNCHEQLHKEMQK